MTRSLTAPAHVIGVTRYGTRLVTHSDPLPRTVATPEEVNNAQDA